MRRELVRLNHFEKYAAFLLKNHIDEFVKIDIKRNFELNLPVLQYFKHLSEEELFALSKKGVQEYLQQIINHQSLDSVLKSMEDWKADKLQGIGRDQLVASDIALIYNARKYSLLTFLPLYTSDINEAITITKEIEDFYTYQEALAIYTYSEIKQEQIRKNELRLKESQALAHMGHWEYTPSDGKVEWSEELYKIYGLDIKTGITAEIIQQHIVADDMKELMEKIRACAEKEHPFEHEYKIKRTDGEIRVLIDHGYCEKDSTGKIVLKGISQDITERKKAEERINETQLFIAKITSSSPNILYVFDLLENRTIYSNRHIAEYFGYTKEEAEKKGNNLSSLLHPNDMNRAAERLEKFKNLKDGEILIFEYRVKCADGTWSWLRTHETVFKRDDKGHATQIIGNAQDITENKKAEEDLNRKNQDLQETNEELARTEESLKELNNELEERVRNRTFELEESVNQFLLLSEIVPQIFWTADAKGDIDYYNQQWYKYTGLNFDNAKGWGWEKVIHPDDLQKTLELWKHSLKTGLPYQIEHRFKRISDGMYRWHLGRALPYKDREGNIIKWFGTMTDVHDQKEALEQVKKAQVGLHSINVELSQKNEELIKTNNDLDNFIYTASHDLKAPISNIEGLTNALKSYPLYEDEEIKSLIDMMTLSVERFKSTIFDLTEITRAQKNFGDEVTELNISEILEEVKFSIHDFIETSKATIESDFSCYPAIKFSKKNFRSILFNLLSNAIKYRAPDRTPKIFIKTEKVNGYILLTIKDNGLGIDAAQKPKIFSMFKRLHDHVEGTGIGLYIVKRTVDNAGGRIEVESEVGKGSTFKVYLKD